MKSSNPSFVTIRRAVVAAAVVLSAGATAVLAQSSSSQGSSSGSSNDMNYSNSANSSGTSSANSDMSSSSSSDMSKNNSNADESSNGSDKLSWSERRFVHKAAKGGESEVALGQLAAEKATNPDVRAYGQQLVQDHQAANSQLMQIAQQKNVKLEQEDGKDHVYNRLSKKSGAEFDREFVDHEIEDHQKDIKEFEKEAKDAKDPDLRNFASQVLPKLRDHLATAQRLKSSIAPTGHEDGNSGRFNAGSSSNTSSTGSSSTGTQPESSSLGTSTSSPTAGANSGMSSGANGSATSSASSSTR